MGKIGIAIITCDRPKFLEKCLESIPFNYNRSPKVVVNDGNHKYNLEQIENMYSKKLVSTDMKLIQEHGKEYQGVCKSKNKAFKYLLEQDCDYIFIIEDDMVFTGDVFEEYIRAYKSTGIHHFSFAYHGPANRGNVSHGTPQPRKVVNYGDVQISLNANCVGAVCFYTRQCLEDVGLFDENFDKNNFEHVDHTYRLAKAGYTTPYWWFADIANSYDYIDEQACSEENSSIRRGDNWQQKIWESAQLFKDKHGYMPAWQGCVPDTPLDSVLINLKKLCITR
jgi:GT2 family glycosyltransferase